MKAFTRVRYAAHLMEYMEELHGLRKFNVQELHVIQEALLFFIEHIQQESAKDQAALTSDMLLPMPTKIYEFQQGNYAPNRIIVYSDGQPERRLQHIPIFSYGFGLAGLPTFDSALAILADYFDEMLSMREFAAGKSRYCHLYQTFAREVLTRPRSLGRFETKHIVTFLRHEYSKNQESGNNELTGLEKHNE